MSERVCVVGPGAVGGLLAARLAAAGVPVSVLGRRGPHLSAIQSRGLRLEWKGEPLEHALRATHDAAEIGVHDYVVIATKTNELAAVADQIAPLTGPDTTLVSAINGLPWWFLHGFGGPLADTALRCIDEGGRLSERFAGMPVIGCVIHLTSAVTAPGEIRHGFGDRLIVGAPDEDGASRCKILARLLGQAGFECRVSDDIRKDVWEKLLGNLNFNPISALTGATVDRIAADPHLSALCAAMVNEAKTVGEAIGIHTPMTPQERIDIALKLGAFKTSMLQDVEKGKPLEIDALVGVVSEMAHALGLPCPAIDGVLGLVRMKAACSGLNDD